MKKKKEKKGGSRKGSGAKSKYGELTATKAFRVPTSKVDELKEIVNAKLSEWTVSKPSAQRTVLAAYRFFCGCQQRTC